MKEQYASQLENLHIIYIVSLLPFSPLFGKLCESRGPIDLIHQYSPSVWCVADIQEIAHQGM